MAYNFSQITGDNVTGAGFSYRGQSAAGIMMNNPPAGADGGDGRLVLPIFAGEVINAYDQYNIFEPMVDARSIASGTTMEFPVTGYVSLNPVWEAGEELIGGTDNKSTTFRVTLDKRPIATHFELDNIDLLLTQWEYRSELARQAGRTLSDARDRQISCYLARAAAEDGLSQDPRATDQHGYSAVGGLGGKVFANEKFDNLGSATATAAQRTDAALKLLEKIEEFQIRLQEVDAPTEGVFCAVKPRTFQDIRALGVARDSSDLAGGAGRPFFGGVADAGGLGAGLQQGMFALADRLEYQGCTIVKTNHLPQHNYGVDAKKIGEDRYNRSFNIAPVKACIWQQACIASLKMMGLKVDQVDDIRRNTVFTVASMMAGTGVMKPEHSAVCVGTYGKEAGATATGEDSVKFAGTVGNRATFTDGSTIIANATFGDLIHDSTTGDLVGFSRFPGTKQIDGGTSGTEVNIGGSSLTDAEEREIYQHSLGATRVDADGNNALGNSASGDNIAGATTFNLEYVDSPAIGIFSNTSPGTDGLGTSG